MNIMCGVLNQTEGEVFVNGISLRENPVEAKKYIGFLPQKPPLYADFTVDEYLVYCAQLRHMESKSIRAAVDYAKEKCGIMHYSKRLISNLSGGYQQRVGIAQAIVHNPLFVVLDEPTNDIDVNTMRALEDALDNFAGCVLVISHDRWFLDRVATHIMAFEGDSSVAFFEGNFTEYEEDRKKRLGKDAETPHRLKFRKLTR